MRHRATVLNCVAALPDMVLTLAEADLPRLPVVRTCTRLYGLGGTTETTIHSTIHEVVSGRSTVDVSTRGRLERHAVPLIIRPTRHVSGHRRRVIGWTAITRYGRPGSSAPAEGVDRCGIELHAESWSVGQVQRAIGVARRRGRQLLAHQQRHETRRPISPRARRTRMAATPPYRPVNRWEVTP